LLNGLENSLSVSDAVVGGSFSTASYRLSLLTFLGEQNVEPEMAPFAELPVTLSWHEYNELTTINRDEVASISIGELIPNGHGNCATPNNETYDARFPLPNPPPQAGEGANESLREFHVNEKQT
jgi:hypothetical protein